MNDKFHLLGDGAVAVAAPQQFTCPFYYEPHPLALMAVEQVQRYVTSRTDWTDELDAGKMLGVLVARDAEGRLGFLAAFSGNLAGSVRHDFFVPPVYDLLDPEGEFKRGEAQISAINHEVKRLMQAPELEGLHERELAARQLMDDEIADFKALMARHKRERDECRKVRHLSADEEENLLQASRLEEREQREDRIADRRR